jgi:hypothetical protein
MPDSFAKIMKNATLLFLSISFIYSCTTAEDIHSGTITIPDVSQPYRGMMHLSRNNTYMKLVITENTLNDTAMMGGIKIIVPGKTGLVFKMSNVVDSMPFNYTPYKATSGTLKLTYTSWWE